MSIKGQLLLLAALSGLGGFADAQAAAAAAGQVVLVAGRGTATSSEGNIRALEKGDAVYSGELISSGPNTYLNLKFSDGAFFLLRPDTRFEIEDYAYAAPGAKPAATAAVAVPAAPVALPAPKTVFSGPSEPEVAQACARSQACRSCRAGSNKNTEDCRVCNARVANCKAMKQAFLAAKNAPPSAPEPAPAAPVAQAPAPAAPVTTPAAPAPSAAIAVAQQDGSSSGTRAFYRLVKGGFRSVSGLIGKVNREDFRVSTPVATIGIRGTEWGARICQGGCEDREQIDLAIKSSGGDSGSDTVLITYVEKGAIQTTTPSASSVQGAGETRIILQAGQIISTSTVFKADANDQKIDVENCQ